MLSKIKLSVLAPVFLLAIVLISCKDDDPTPDNPKEEKPCLISQSAMSDFQLNYLYDNNSKLIEVNSTFGGKQTFRHVSDTLIEEGSLNAVTSSFRTSYLLMPNGNLKSIITEMWNPQFGFGLVQATITKQDYVYLPNGNFSELITYDANYFVDSATGRPLGNIRLKRNGKTIISYGAEKEMVSISLYYINPDGTEFLSSTENITAYQTEETGNANALSAYFLPMSGQNRNVAIGKPLYVGSKVPKVFETNGGFSNSKRTFTFRLNELKQVQTIEEEIDTDFGFPFTSTTNLQWICP
jgi:hypothetical protein